MPLIALSDTTEFEIHGSRFRSYVSPSKGSEQLCAWQLVVPPRLTGTAHRPTRDEVILVLDGQLLVTLDGSPSTLRRGDAVLVPAASELQIDGGPTEATAWVTTTPGLEAVTRDGTRISPPWVR